MECADIDVALPRHHSLNGFVLQNSFVEILTLNMMELWPVGSDWAKRGPIITVVSSLLKRPQKAG